MQAELTSCFQPPQDSHVERLTHNEDSLKGVFRVSGGAQQEAVHGSDPLGPFNPSITIGP